MIEIIVDLLEIVLCGFFERCIENGIIRILFYLYMGGKGKEKVKNGN